MIYDRITNVGLYAFENPELAAAVRDIRSNLLGDAAEAGGFKKNRITFTTVPLTEKRFEAHKKYIDIHIVLEGREYVEVSHIDCLSDRTEYKEESDIIFGDVASDRKFCGYLERGSFLVCFPEDTHLVGAHVNDEIEVTKLVYKIAVDY